MVKAFTRQRKHREKGSQRPSSTSAGRDQAGEGRGLPDSLGPSPCLPRSVTLAFKDLQLDCPKERGQPAIAHPPEPTSETGKLRSDRGRDPQLDSDNFPH